MLYQLSYNLHKGRLMGLEPTTDGSIGEVSLIYATSKLLPWGTSNKRGSRLRKSLSLLEGYEVTLIFATKIYAKKNKLKNKF